MLHLALAQSFLYTEYLSVDDEELRPSLQEGKREFSRDSALLSGH